MFVGTCCLLLEFGFFVFMGIGYLICWLGYYDKANAVQGDVCGAAEHLQC